MKLSIRFWMADLPTNQKTGFEIWMDSLEERTETVQFYLGFNASPEFKSWTNTLNSKGQLRNLGRKFIVTEMVFYHSVYSALFKKQVLLHADWMIILVLTFYKLRKGVKFLLNEHSHFHATAFSQDFLFNFVPL